ncbi:apolipoprotein N-acyltransferase [Microvirga antarctica]|uniref:apolipoprotein N-acyltransferase n=1 Tax=Microvirga antarctica TaxID=2819233 RepID=UPI001B3043F5|nr:apolipoprotein N-acyltransferase [Microvirga antarctica]
MNALPDRLTRLSGWRRSLMAAACGAVGALAMPPLGLWHALVVALVPAIWLLDTIAADTVWGRLRAAALIGWSWGFGYFVAGLWWLGAAFLVEADQFAWAMPLGVVGLPAVLAFFTAFGFALSRLLWTPGAGRILTFAAALTISEWLRGHLFTGFPWNNPGMAFGQSLWLMQSASVIGLYGLTLVSLAICASPALILTGPTTGQRWAAPTLAAVGLGAMALFGAWRLPDGPVETVDGVTLRIMQPNLPQDAKFNPRNRDAIMRRYLAISRYAGQDGGTLEGATHLIWPESAFPFLLHRDPGALAQIASILRPGALLLTGAARMEEPLPGEAAGRFFNAIQAIDHQGTILGSYDKVHLVPFGEYVPAFLESAIRALGLKQFVSIPGGFSAGGRRTRLAVPGLPPVAATICYEAIFPDEIFADGPRPSLILNVTNDAWFGLTPGPYQHFAQARLRAVEEGLPLIRAANTGISAVIDPFGRVVASLPLGTEGVLDAGLPRSLSQTVYGKSGRFVLTAMLVICLMAPALRRRKRPSPRAPSPTLS